MAKYVVHHGEKNDNLEVLKHMVEDGVQVDAVITDPPYGLKFMGKRWDYDVPSVEFWQLVFEVLKPGGHVLSFGGTRTYDRMVVNLEDAGFEMRDQIVWLYGSGFPKSMDISKAVDKAAGVRNEVDDNEERTHQNTLDGGVLGSRCTTCGKPYFSANPCKCPKPEPVTEEAKAWAGWGTALKPANEPIVLARKPPAEDTVAGNVLQYGTGALNIDGCRVPYEAGGNLASNPSLRTYINGGNGGRTFPTETDRRVVVPNQQGRWPANVILDEEAGVMLDEQTGNLGSSHGGGMKRDGQGRNNVYSKKQGHPQVSTVGYGDTGGASRFFYCAKASKKESRGSKHERAEQERQIAIIQRCWNKSNLGYWPLSKREILYWLEYCTVEEIKAVISVADS